MGILEDYLHKIPDDITLDVRVKDKVLAEIKIKDKEIIVDLKSPILALETIIKQVLDKKIKSGTIQRLQAKNYKIKVKWKGITFDL